MLATLLVTSLIPSASGATLTVGATCSTPCNYTTLVAAVAAAQSGDTLQLNTNEVFLTDGLVVDKDLLIAGGFGTALQADPAGVAADNDVINFQGANGGLLSVALIPRKGGRGVDIDGGAITLGSVQMVGQTSSSGSVDGFGVRVVDADVNMVGVFFLGDTTDTTGSVEHGGAVYIDNTQAAHTVSITGSAFISDHAEEGGAIYAIGGSLVVDGSTNFNGNEATTSGGALQASLIDVSLLGGTHFNGNKAPMGGQLRITDGTLFSSDIQYLSGVATDGNGGALLLENVYGEIDGGTFSLNTAPQGVGGHIAISGNGYLTLDSVELRAGQAVSGGAIYDDGVYLEAHHVQFGDLADPVGYANSADNGGDVYAKGATVLFDDITSISALANQSGGSLYQDGGDITVILPRFDDAHAKQGAGIYQSGGSLFVQNGSFDGCGIL